MSLAPIAPSLLLPAPTRAEPLTSLELFAGAGGLAVGTHAAGFKLLGLVERNASAVKTLRNNSQRVLGLDPELVIEGDAREVDYRPFAGRVDLLTAGAPCQPFSQGGKKLGPEDPRNLFPLIFDLLPVVMPRAILIENVKGLSGAAFSDYRDYIVKRLQFPLHTMLEGESWREHDERLSRVTGNQFGDEEQYVVAFQVLDTADYGVPQRRERIIFTAFRRDLGIDTFRLEATHSKRALLIAQWVTGEYWEEHPEAPREFARPSDKKLLETLRRQTRFIQDKPRWRTVRDAIAHLPPPVERGAEAMIPNHVQHPGARSYTNHTGSHWDYPAKALKAGTHGTPGGENMLRLSTEDDVRYFTTREAALLQTFSDDWHFEGPWGACIRQLGNAVPVEMARLFAQKIHERLAAN